MIGQTSMTDMTLYGMLLYVSVSQTINHETKHQFLLYVIEQIKRTTRLTDGS
jgi:hypothetical protein